jgi:hypothetical protein
MDIVFLTSVLGALASVLGLAIAVLQSIRLRQLKRRTNADVWLSIRTARSLIGKLEGSQSVKQEPVVAGAYAQASELFRHLIKQAVLDERRFSEDTIRRWRAAGKIDTDWQAAQARQFLPTYAIDLYTKTEGAA